MDTLFKQKKFGDDMLAELSYEKFQEAKRRLRHFVINTDMTSDKEEKSRLLSYFKHRQHTLVMILKECYKARKANGGKFVEASGDSVLKHGSEETQKIFKLVNKSKQVENLTQD